MDPASLGGAFQRVFAEVQRGKAPEQFTWLRYHLLSVDGKGYFSSKKVHCDHCCQKKHRDGSVTCYHQMLGVVLVHPQRKPVIPLSLEPIMQTDGSKKNDCERNAAKRMLPEIRREQPYWKLLVVEDGMVSNGTLIQLL